ncbi:MAG: sigma 54-interacting transcriptional regulator [Planctomycetes bacterium]|nr:sigma 54-interacting transcriptional regulator [Planctomycetota bacterium]
MPEAVRYRYLRRIGRGSEGEIFLAEDLWRDATPVAFKVLPPDRRLGTPAQEIPAEFRHLATIRHRSLARVFDAGRFDPVECVGFPGVADGAPFFTSEYFTGRPLSLLANWSWTLFESVLHECCEVLAALNFGGYRHGDLKPAHILIDEPSCRLRVVDLGQAARLDRRDRTATTLAYAPPELWTAGRHPHRNSDLYSLAMTALECITGRLPVISADPAAWRAWHRAGDRHAAFRDARSGLPPRLRDLLISCLSPNPSERPPDARSLARDLRATSSFGSDAEEIVPFVGRRRELRRLQAWAAGEGPRALLLTGARGVGKSRLAALFARTLRVRGQEVRERRSGVPPSTARSTVEIWDEADEDPIDLLRRGATRTLVIARPASIDRDRLRHAIDEGLDVEIAWIPGLAREDVDALAVDLLGVAPPLDRLDEIWLRSGTKPRLIADALRGEAASNGVSAVVSPLRRLVDSMPTSISLLAIAALFGRTLDEVLSDLRSDDDLSPRIEGTEPDLTVRPRPSPLFDEASVRRWVDAGDPRDSDVLDAMRAILERDTSRLRGSIEALGNERRCAEVRAMVALAGQVEWSASASPHLSWLDVLRHDVCGRCERARDLLDHLDPRDPSTDFARARLAARILERQGDPRAAERWQRCAMERASTMSDSVDAMIDTVRLLQSVGERSEAVELIRRLDSTTERARIIENCSAESLGKLGSLLHQLGRGDAAKEIFQYSLLRSRRRGSSSALTTVNALSGLSAHARAHRDLDEARRLLSLGIRYASLCGVSDRARHLEANLAATLHEAGETERAAERYRALLPLVLRERNHHLTPFVAQGLGTILREQGDLIGSLRVQLRALRIARSSENDQAAAGLSSNLGELYLLLGDPPTAYRHRLRELRIARRLGDPQRVCRGRIDLGAALCRRGRLNEAARMLAIADDGEVSGRVEPLIASHRAEVAWLSGMTRLALEQWARTIRTSRSTRRLHYWIRGVIGIGRIVEARGDSRRADRILDLAWSRAEQAADPRFARIDVALERLRLTLSRRIRSGEAVPVSLAMSCFEVFRDASRAQRAEEALAALSLGWRALRSTEKTRVSLADVAAPTDAETRPLISRFRKRLGPDDRAALDCRLAIPGGISEYLEEADFEPSSIPVSHAFSAKEDLERALRSLVEVAGLHQLRVIASPDRRARVIASWSERGIEYDDRAGTVPGGPPRGDSLEIGEGRFRVRLDLGLFEPAWIEGAEVGLERNELGELETALVRVLLEAGRDRDRMTILELERRLDDLRSDNARERHAAETAVMDTAGALESSALETSALARRTELLELASRVPAEVTEQPIVSRSPEIRALERQFPKWCGSDVPLLVYGESGVGKSLLVQRIHSRSPRGAHPIVIENCSALPEPLLEAELFGYVPGAFTGADRVHDGIFARSDGTTLVLDHLDELPIGLQGRLLRVIETQRFRPLGTEVERSFNARIVTTCRTDPETAVAVGRLREDLYYRISAIAIRVPPLRERVDDIEPLLHAYTVYRAKQVGRPAPFLTADALERLIAYQWPGNVRELDNLTQRWLVERHERIGRAEIPPAARSAERPRDVDVTRYEGDWRTATASFQRDLLRRRLARADWNQTRVARELGVTRRHLTNLIAKLEIEIPSAKRSSRPDESV